MLSIVILNDRSCEDVQSYNTGKHANDSRRCCAGIWNYIVDDILVRVIQVHDLGSIICMS